MPSACASARSAGAGYVSPTGLAQAGGVDLDAHAGRRHGAQRRARGGRHRLARPAAARTSWRGPGAPPRRTAPTRPPAASARGSRGGCGRCRRPRSRPAISGWSKPKRSPTMCTDPMTYSNGYCRSAAAVSSSVSGMKSASMPSTMRTSRGVLARQVQDRRAVVVQLVRAHGPVVGEVVPRLPAAEERQVVGEAHLVHAQRDGALDVLPRLALGVPAHARVDVIVGDHGGHAETLGPPVRQAYTRRPAPAARPPAPAGRGRARRGRRRANSSTSSTPATNPPTWAKNATPASPGAPRPPAAHGLDARTRRAAGSRRGSRTPATRR